MQHRARQRALTPTIVAARAGVISFPGGHRYAAVFTRAHRAFEGEPATYPSSARCRKSIRTASSMSD
jgi:hypothetical protein